MNDRENSPSGRLRFGGPPKGGPTSGQHGPKPGRQKLKYKRVAKEAGAGTGTGAQDTPGQVAPEPERQEPAVGKMMPGGPDRTDVQPQEASGQHGPKPMTRPGPSGQEKQCRNDARGTRAGSKFRQTPNKARPSENLRPDAETSKERTGGMTKENGDGPASGSPETGKKAAREDRRLNRSKYRAEKAGERLAHARGRLAMQKPLKHPGPAKHLIRKVKFSTWAFAHGKIREVERENVGTEAAHKAELAAGAVFRGTARFAKSRARATPARRVYKYEKQEVSARARLAYRQHLHDSPDLKQKPLARAVQKHNIKRQYARQARKSLREGKKAARGAAKSACPVAGFIHRHPKIFVVFLALSMAILLLQSCVASVVAIGNGLMGVVGGTSYLAEDADIDSAELSYTEWETDLLIKVSKTEDDYPGYDEYRYQVGDVSHNPYELMAYLTAVHDDFTYAEVAGTLREIFSQQYALEHVRETEVRYRTETRTDTWTDAYGNPQSNTYEVEVAYDYHILNVSLTARPFTEIIYPLMDAGERERFSVYMVTKGNRQYLKNPFGSMDWTANISGGYGYRIHPAKGIKDYHKGTDIVSGGAEVLAGFDGAVAFAGESGDYGLTVVLEGSGGIVAKYAHCRAIHVSTGQAVLAGQPIATSGQSMHLEVLKDGRHLNPLFFTATNSGAAGPDYGTDPGVPMGDGSLAALIADAEKHLGKPYVFGAGGPDSFDCSSFVCWVYTHSGTYQLPRTTAQGIYNQCIPIPPDAAQPGDLIFFTGTYSTPNTCSHVGIYVGNGRMVHAGSPVQYTSINTPYWQGHFYSFGRLP